MSSSSWNQSGSEFTSSQVDDDSSKRSQKSPAVQTMQAPATRDKVSPPSNNPHMSADHHVLHGNQNQTEQSLHPTRSSHRVNTSHQQRQRGSHALHNPPHNPSSPTYQNDEGASIPASNAAFPPGGTADSFQFHQLNTVGHRPRRSKRHDNNYHRHPHSQQHQQHQYQQHPDFPHSHGHARRAGHGPTRIDRDQDTNHDYNHNSSHQHWIDQARVDPKSHFNTRAAEDGSPVENEYVMVSSSSPQGYGEYNTHEEQLPFGHAVHMYPALSDKVAHPYNGDHDARRKPHPQQSLDANQNTESAFHLSHGSDTSNPCNIDAYDNAAVSVVGPNAPRQIQAFGDVLLHQVVAENMKKQGYLKPSLVQKHAIPIGLSRLDFICCAQTGSGKTAAYLLPIIQLLLTPYALYTPHEHTILHKITRDHHIPHRHTFYPQALVLGPTRELITQISRDAYGFTRNTPITIGAIYGGYPYQSQYETMQLNSYKSRRYFSHPHNAFFKGFPLTIVQQSTYKITALTTFPYLGTGCDILVATPGRLNDFLSNGDVSLAFIRMLVLDEADRMLDMGFIPQIDKILDNYDLPKKHRMFQPPLGPLRSFSFRGGREHETGEDQSPSSYPSESDQHVVPILDLPENSLPGKPSHPSVFRQTMLFSATFPEEVQALVNRYLYQPLMLTIGRIGVSTELVTQHVISYTDGQQSEKQGQLISLVQQCSAGLTLIFVERRADADTIWELLHRNNVKCVSIHGDKGQRQRESALRSFTRGDARVLVATDVASRGISIDNVNYVINYDLPRTIDDYVHRIGRTGRFGSQGSSFTLIADKTDNVVARDIYQMMCDTQQEIPQWFDDQIQRTFYRNRRGRQWKHQHQQQQYHDHHHHHHHNHNNTREHFPPHHPNGGAVHHDQERYYQHTPHNAYHQQTPHNAGVRARQGRRQHHPLGSDHSMPTDIAGEDRTHIVHRPATHHSLQPAAVGGGFESNPPVTSLGSHSRVQPNHDHGAEAASHPKQRVARYGGARSPLRQQRRQRRQAYGMIREGESGLPPFVPPPPPDANGMYADEHSAGSMYYHGMHVIPAAVYPYPYGQYAMDQQYHGGSYAYHVDQQDHHRNGSGSWGHTNRRYPAHLRGNFTGGGDSATATATAASPPPPTATAAAAAAAAVVSTTYF